MGQFGTAASLASLKNCGKFSASVPPGPGGVQPASPFIIRKIPLRTLSVAEQKISPALFH